jgi:hypothetical protein
LEFSPFLFRHVVPKLDHSWSGFISSPYLGSIRSLTVTSDAFLLDGTNGVSKMNEPVQQLLAKTHNLEAFT